MANTGFIQATIAYKVARPSGEPLDINGKPISETGRRQAIYLLLGTDNPNPLLFEVEGYFPPNALIYGAPTAEFDPAKCPTGLIFVTPDRVLLEPNGAPVNLTLFSSGAWELVSGQPFVSVAPVSGGTGYDTIILTPNALEGQGAITFKNTVSGDEAQVYVISVVDPSVWILATGYWNNLGFWFDGELWNTP